MNRGGRAWRGFFPVGEELTSGRPDMKEGLYFGTELPACHPLVEAGIPLHGPNLFPDNMPELKESVLQYIEAMNKLGHSLMGAVAASLGLPQTYFQEKYMRPEPLSLFRIFNYPKDLLASIDGEERWGVGEHTDYGVLTILRQDSCGGLQVKNRSNAWIEAPPVHGSFVINIGDMLEKMTSGLYRSTPHRVKNTASKDRLSFPFFFDPNFSAVIQPVALPPMLAGSIHRGDEGYTRWDGSSVEDFKGTYGEYIIRKVFKVFPDLAKEANIDETISAMAAAVAELNARNAIACK
ncbi:hypothetical protein CEUSTIGMA_g9180.t1 [Chlamydomonas eustigma]|uniref:Fe2OG dioxygenase domain-containing protein n=1 Tax=Chlamydomonas eustigma TaxID=1157962 RepID=A0A250XFR5_9CHLO|nr:hypothetical protein CEUSTIGMA_g9180.t1 [Chlamydomonas eustigma]|eukprot:GAX81752.1 hypothetical protein CEUSTIGMA_g9180.t1 [Chlamydomonas eustigma]